MRHAMALVCALGVCAGLARGEVRLFAKYDWKEGARDVSGSPIRHDGVLGSAVDGYDPFIENGLMNFNGLGDVSLGHVPELDGATQFQFRFENLTYYQYSESPRASSDYSVLIGDEMRWWAGVFYDLTPGSQRTMLELRVGADSAHPAKLNVVVAESLIPHFDSLEYRFDGTAPLAERFAVRWNDGPWVVGGEGGEVQTALATTSSRVWLNNALPSDMDEPMFATVGTVSLSSNIVVPEPGAAGLACAAGLGLLRRQRSRCAGVR